MPTKRRRSSRPISKSHSPNKRAKLAQTEAANDPLPPASESTSAVVSTADNKVASFKTLPETLTDPGWREALKPLFEAESWQKLVTQLDVKRAAGEKIYPPLSSVFRAFNVTPLASIKVVILGQDPYHGAGQADGLAFSFSGGENLPPSLKNIFKELQADIAGFVAPKAGSLEKWAQQGVLLLNTALTVAEGKPGSHTKLGWTEFTDSVLSLLSNGVKKGVVFLLWGKPAQSKAKLITASSNHIVLEAAHPSPAACGAFSGCRIFSKANETLVSRGFSPIDWKLV